jgi:hypothetical protein
VFRTLENERERRYQAAGDVRTALDHVAGQPPPPPPPPAPPEVDANGRIVVRPRTLRERKTAEGAGTPAEPPGEWPPPRAWLIAVAAGLLLLVLVRGAEAVVLILLLALLVYLAVCGFRLMHQASTNAMFWLAHPADAPRPRPHGCLAMLAFAAALILALAPAVLAWMASSSKRAVSWNVEWMGILAGCGVLSFFAIQPFLRLTGMHRGAKVQRRIHFLGWIGAFLCMAAMAGSGFLARSGTVHELEWDNGGGDKTGEVDQRNAEFVVEKVFGTDSGIVRVSDRGTVRAGDRGQHGLKISAAGTPVRVDALLLDCAARFDAMEGRLPDNKHDWRMNIRSVPNMDMPLSVLEWFVGSAWVMAAGAWLLAIRARASRRRLLPLLVLLVSGGAAWGVYKSGIGFWGLMPLVDGKILVAEDRQDFAAVPPEDSAESTVMGWIKAVRTGEGKRAPRQKYEALSGVENLETPDGARFLGELKSARILGLHGDSDRGVDYVFCHLAMYRNVEDNRVWDTRWLRFKMSPSTDGPRVSAVSFQPSSP